MLGFKFHFRSIPGGKGLMAQIWLSMGLSQKANLHGGSQPLCRNSWSGNFKRGKGIAIVGRCCGGVDGGAGGNATHSHLKIGVKNCSKIVVLRQRFKAKKRQQHPLLCPFDCQRPCQILHSCSCCSWEERRVFPMKVIVANNFLFTPV